MIDPSLLAELLSKLGSITQAPADAAPSNTRRQVAMDIHIQGSIITTETDVDPGELVGQQAPDK